MPSLKGTAEEPLLRYRIDMVFLSETTVRVVVVTHHHETAKERVLHSVPQALRPYSRLGQRPPASETRMLIPASALTESDRLDPL